MLVCYKKRKTLYFTDLCRSYHYQTNKICPLPADLEMLEERWGYTTTFQKAQIPSEVSIIKVKGKPYFAASDFTKAIGKHIYTNGRGLVLISDTPIKYTTNPIIDDCVVNLFAPLKNMLPLIWLSAIFLICINKKNGPITHVLPKNNRKTWKKGKKQNDC